MLQVSQRPLQATAVDTTLFVNRSAELEKLARSVRLGFNSLVLGERGSGKTSLLRRFQWQLAEAGSSVRFVEASGATTVEELVDLVYVAIHRQGRNIRIFPIQGKDPSADVRSLRPADGEHAVVLLDSVTRPEVLQHLFGRLRDDVWQLPLTWVVSGNRPDRNRYMEPPADSFFDAVIELDEFDEGEALELLRRRALGAGSGDPAAEVLLTVAPSLAQRVTPRSPRNLLAAAREVLLSKEDPTQSVTNLYALQWRAAELSRPAAMLFAEIMDLGAVSASDKRLLERLGWTRARAAQVVKQLEEAGLVVATDATSGAPGRPRKLYSAISQFHGPGQEDTPS